MKDYSNRESNAAEKQALLEELTLANAPAIQDMRTVASTAVPITVRPADSIARENLELSGRAHSVRRNSVAALLGKPITVGSFFELQLGADGCSDSQQVVFARCDQVAMSGEGRFETRFQLMEAIDIPTINAASSDS